MALQIEKRAEFHRHQGPIYSLTQGRRADTVFSAGADGIVSEWDLGTGEPEAFHVNVGHPIYSIHTVPEKRWLLIGRASGALHVVDLEAKKELRLLELHRRGIFDIAYDPAMDRFYTAGGDGLLSVFQGEELELFRTIPLAEGKLRKLDLDREKGHLAVATGDARVHVLETEMYNEVLTLPCHSPGANVVKFLSDGRTLLSAGRDGHLDVWDRENAEGPIHHLPAHYYAIYAIVTNEDGFIAATASRDKSIKLWDPYEGKFLDRIDRKGKEGHARSVNALHWSVGAASLVSAGDDARVMVWGVENSD